ncbi:MAG: hypothetical protein OXF62_04225 [Caldilineaceae bacterium]|nr:hypothetical protein [Caldilineaceae bacterium]
MSIPRPEYPRPQFVRSDWLCLNGEWEFEIDQGDSGLERGLLERPLVGSITVPFCPESQLSGVGNNDFLEAVWYRRQVEIPSSWAGRRVLLHFQAVDYDATVWVNGQEVGRHRGGFSPFTCDLSGAAAPGDRTDIVVRARDSHRDPQPRGKQAQTYAPRGAIYLRTTGIWQSVWMEPVPDIHLGRPRLTPDTANGVFRLEQPLVHRPGVAEQAKPVSRKGLKLHAQLLDAAGLVSEASCSAELDLGLNLDLAVPAERRRLWSPEDPHLYDVILRLVDGDGTTLDEARSYAGLRSVAIDGKAITLNGDPVFQRLVLDQGYYPDGIMTAPSDEALRRDIELSIDAGFNGARLHQKVFEERFLYHADRLGYLLWGEFGDWGCRAYGPQETHQQPTASYITEWLEVLERDYSHPSIIGWCPLNETWQPLHDRITTLDAVTRGLFLATKAMDLTRPVLDTSGYSHRVPEADVYDCHDYTQDVDTFASNHAGTGGGRPHFNGRDGQPWSMPYRGQPFFVSEFGGIWWNPDAGEEEYSWGYGERPCSIEEFYRRFTRLCAVLLGDPAHFGYCYTQLTDIYQEQNGIYRFDRSAKFDMARIRSAQQVRAAIESG